MGIATGIGSMPGTDYAESVHVVLGEVGLPFVPELPARGVYAGMIGRTLGLLDGLGADLQPAGWRVGAGEGIDQRRARSLLAQDLDTVEELAAQRTGPFKSQVTGPLTLAAVAERPRGDKMLADHGARRELAESLAAGLVEHVADLRRRLGDDLVVQVDEPMLTQVLAGRVPTASGWGTHRTMYPPEADELLRLVTAAIADTGARPVVHSCAEDVPVALLAGAGFTAISFDVACAARTTEQADAWAEAYESGVDLWAGAVPTVVPPDRPRPDGPPSPSVTDATVWTSVGRFFDRLGFDEGSYSERLVVTPTCGLAGASPQWARRALELASTVASAH